MQLEKPKKQLIKQHFVRRRTEDFVRSKTADVFFNGNLNIQDPQTHAARQATGEERIIKNKEQIHIPTGKRQRNINQFRAR